MGVVEESGLGVVRECPEWLSNGVKEVPGLSEAFCSAVLSPGDLRSGLGTVLEWKTIRGSTCNGLGMWSRGGPWVVLDCFRSGSAIGIEFWPGLGTWSWSGPTPNKELSSESVLCAKLGSQSAWSLFGVMPAGHQQVQLHKNLCMSCSLRPYVSWI